MPVAICGPFVIPLSPFAEGESEAGEGRAYPEGCREQRRRPPGFPDQDTVTTPQSISGLLGNALDRKKWAAFVCLFVLF